MKNILASLGAAAVMLASASPSLGFWMPRQPDVLTNVATINTTMDVRSNTGMNLQLNGGLIQGDENTPKTNFFGGSFGGGWNWGSNDLTLDQLNSMQTGHAESTGIIQIEANNGVDCGCFDEVNNTADVNTTVDVRANSGKNVQLNLGMIEPSRSSDDLTLTQTNGMVTGNAVAGAQVWTIVNSSYSMAE